MDLGTRYSTAAFNERAVERHLQWPEMHRELQFVRTDEGSEKCGVPRGDFDCLAFI